VVSALSPGFSRHLSNDDYSEFEREGCPNYTVYYSSHNDTLYSSYSDCWVCLPTALAWKVMQSAICFHSFDF